jgi:hypothetical protein
MNRRRMYCRIILILPFGHPQLDLAGQDLELLRNEQARMQPASLVMYSRDYGSFVAQSMNRLGARDRQRVPEDCRQRDEKC